VKEKINELKSQSFSREQIAEILSISASTVSKYLPGPLTDVGKEIQELRKRGLSYKEIQKETGYSKCSISKWCKDLPIKKEKPQKKRKEHPRQRSSDTYRRWKAEARRGRMTFFRGIYNNKCCICGYDKSSSALQFHHVNPTTKEFIIGGVSAEYSIQRLISEVNKCILICSNCHFEIHDGLLNVNIEPIKINISLIPKELITFEPIEIDISIKENEFKWIKDKLNSLEKEAIEPLDNPEIDLFKVYLKEIPRKLHNDLCKKYHYLSVSHKGGIKVYGLFNGSEIIGSCLITNPIRQGNEGFVEISRFILIHNQRNLASKFLSLIIKDLKKENKWKGVQSFSDPSRHLGTIYKASNFKETGYGSKTYNYNGIHKKTIYERARSMGLSEHRYAEIFGLERIKESKKVKFIFTF